MGQQPIDSVTGNHRRRITLRQLLQTIQEEENSNVLLEMTTAYISQRFDFQAIWISLYDPLTHELIGKGGVAAQEDRDYLRQRMPLIGGSYLEQVIIQQCRVEVPNLQTENAMGRWQQIAQTLEIQRTLLFPLSYRHRCYGVVLLGATAMKPLLKPKEQEKLTIIFKTLATALHHIEARWQQHRSNHPNQLILRLLSQFLPDSLEPQGIFDAYLEQVAEAAHQFLEPNRTSIYWYQPQGHFFWRRTGNSRKVPEPPSHRPTSGLILQDLEEFYQGLIQDRLVTIGAAQSSLSPITTELLTQRFHVHSLLAAPIQSHQGLLGFILVESQVPRIWQTAEKTFLQDVAQLQGIIAPLSELETNLQQTEADFELMTTVARLMLSTNPDESAISQVITAFCQHLNIAWYWLLQAQPHQPEQLDILYQHQPTHRRSLTAPLRAAKPLDIRRLQQSSVIALETWGKEKPFQGWRKALNPLGVRAVLVCEIAGESATFGMAGHEIARHWTRREQELFRMVGQQLGVILHQQRRRRQDQLHQQLADAIATNWKFWQQTQPVDELVWHFIQQLAQVLQSPWTALITRLGQKIQSHIVQLDLQNGTYKSRLNLTAFKSDDNLIRRILTVDDPIWIGPEALPELTRQQLELPQVQEIILIPLKTAADESPSGAVIVANPVPELRSPLGLQLTLEFVQQLAWQRQTLITLKTSQTQQVTLKQLNWYKQAHLENLYRTWGKRSGDIEELEQLLFHATDPRQRQIAHLRYQQLLRQMHQTLNATAGLLEQEHWKLHNAQDLIHVDQLLRRLRKRLQPLVESRQVLLQIHQGHRLNMIGDRFKLELILYELLKLACERSQPTEIVRVDATALNPRQFELRITDSGQVVLPSPSLKSQDILAFSPTLRSGFTTKSPKTGSRVGELDGRPTAFPAIAYGSACD
ncbi:MAG: GAF domain-containing protein [Oscillatoriales cyanobacterium RM2_1_1]|nr:GAF domain-containing protein [Oscillatoriales cyanobacterium RM2_1_1]